MSVLGEFDLPGVVPGCFLCRECRSRMGNDRSVGIPDRLLSPATPRFVGSPVSHPGSAFLKYALVSQCSATVRHCSCYIRCSATPFYDIEMPNLRCYSPPKRTEAAATVPCFRPFPARQSCDTLKTQGHRCYTSVARQL